MIHGASIEICISNNQSTDNTLSILEKWSPKLDFKAITQSENIGLTLNFIAVSKIASGKWIMIVGDDDAFILDNFAKLLKHLGSSDEHDWILSGVADATGKETLLGDLKYGHYSHDNFKNTE